MTNLVKTDNLISQEAICQMQDAIHDGALPKVELEYEHFFADGVYVRMMKCPAGAVVIGKPHRTEHISILLEGSCTITDDDGSTHYVEAPLIVVTPPGKKKMALVHTNMKFLNIHPTTTTDLDEIEKKVIIPEEEFRTMLLTAAELTKELTTNKENEYVVG